jgi:hypothetical protein
MIFNNKTYDILKFVAITFIPALATFVGTVGIAVGYPETTGIIVTVLTALGSFIGALVGLSSASYNKGVK